LTRIIDGTFQHILIIIAPDTLATLGGSCPACRLGRGGVTRSSRVGGTTRPARTDRAQNQAIRDWVKRKKIKLSREQAGTRRNQ
jgi:hypothetical protein